MNSFQQAETSGNQVEILLHLIKRPHLRLRLEVGVLYPGKEYRINTVLSGARMRHVWIKRLKTDNGYLTERIVYECESCSG